MNEVEKFEKEVASNIESLSNDKDVQALSRIWIREISPHKYAYNFRWLGRPAIQFPQDQVALQELIWSIKPDLIIETGIAHGGSLMFSASMLALLDIEEAINAGNSINPNISKRKVLGIDVDIRDHNKIAIEAHPMASRIQMIEGSSIDSHIINQVQEIAKDYQTVLVCLDSNHTHEHVLAELEAYAPLTSINSYCIVYDTAVEDMPKELSGDRPWGPGDNPKTAVWEYLKTHPEFEIDKSIQNKLLITVAPDGYLKRIV
jgi:cephalosporin hydroxylase